MEELWKSGTNEINVFFMFKMTSEGGKVWIEISFIDRAESETN